jgi:hypothetical protein
MVKLLDSLALETGIAVFHRFAVMQHWSAVQRIPFRTFTSNDGLHMNDWSYDRIAKLLADAIVEASGRSTQTTRARSSGKARS